MDLQTAEACFEAKIASYQFTRAIRRDELLDTSRKLLGDLRGDLFAFGRDKGLSTRAMSRLTGLSHSTIARALKRHDEGKARLISIDQALETGPEKGERTIVDQAGEVRVVKTGLTPIDRLVKRQILPAGAGLASRAYHVDFMRAGDMGRQKSQLGRFSGKTGCPDPERQEADRMDAQQRLQRLQERLSGSQLSILAHVCGLERGLSEWVFNARVAKPVALGILYSALETAARFYGVRWALAPTARVAA